MKRALLLLVIALTGWCQFLSPAMNMATQAVNGQETTVSSDYLQSMIDKAKAESESWNEQQWKEFIASSLSILSPYVKVAAEIRDHPEDYPALKQKLDEASEQVTAFNPMMDEMDRIIEESPLASQLVKDEEFMKAVLLLAGLPEDTFDLLPRSSEYKFEEDGDDGDDGDDSDFEAPVELDPELEAMIYNAQTEGENWTEQQWKDAFKLIFEKMALLLTEVNNLHVFVDTNKDDSDDMSQIYAQILELEMKYKGFEKQMVEFEAAAKATTIGTRLINDDDFMKTIIEETGADKLLPNDHTSE